MNWQELPMATGMGSQLPQRDPYPNEASPYDRRANKAEAFILGTIIARRRSKMCL